MSVDDPAGDSDGDSVTPRVPEDLLASHPETAYFWGRVAGDGDLSADCVTVRASDEIAARRIAAIAGAQRVDHHIAEREYAHDATITRTEDEYAIQVFGDVAERASAALGLPIDGDPGGYRFDAFDGRERHLLRGLLESCGTVCFKQSSGTVGVSFVHDDRRLLATIRSLLDRIDPDAPVGDLAETSSGGYWFGIDDDAVPEVGPWWYHDCEDTGLFSPSRRRKLFKSLERAEVSVDGDLTRQD